MKANEFTTLEEKLAARPEELKHANITPVLDEHGVKKPRLFYWEEAVDSFVPAPEKVENIVDAEFSFEEGDEITITFKRFDMSDAEMEALPTV